MTQHIDDKDMAKMIVYLMERHFPCRTLDPLISALDVAVLGYETAAHRTGDEYYHDWKYLLELFRSIQTHDDDVFTSYEEHVK